MSAAFDRIGATLDQFVGGQFREVLTVGVVGTFATGWLLPRLAPFNLAHPGIDLRGFPNTNRLDLAGERLVQPFALTRDAGRNGFTRLRSRPQAPAIQAFHLWLAAESAATDGP